MSVQRQVSIPSRDEFAATAEAVFADVGLHESIAEDIFAELSAAEQARTSIGAIVARVRERIDPELIDILYEIVQPK